ncbi:luciferase family protein [Dyadobacter sp. 3J3]|uniref:luciferase domain-containing protein n=1 Tax=Dyadobacter sp. 3J3 TaxID=2606600 RepID=UPI001356BF1D|nr:luciferase family protein [Dyadobacter sp. 3J3]
MTLEEKGIFAPAPTMSMYPQMVSTAIQQWKNVISATHWDLYDSTKVDGADFYVGKNELGHIHLDGSVHLATTNELRIPLLKNNLAKKFPYAGEYEGWVLFKITSESDVKQAIWLFQLNYERLMGVSIETLISKIENHKIK